MTMTATQSDGRSTTATYITMNFPTAPSNPPSSQKPTPQHPSKPPKGQPSHSRRLALKTANETTPIPLSNLTPITKYYDAADKVLAQFKLHLSKGELDDAYIIGRRFALFSTVSLPSHHYYGSHKYGQERRRNQKDAEWVMGGLERIVECMDREEVKREEERIRQQNEEEQRKRKEEEKKKAEWEEKMKNRVLAVESSGLGDLDSKSSGAENVNDKLAKLNDLFPKDGQAVAENSGQEVVLEKDEAVVATSAQDVIHNNTQDNELPPPIPLPSDEDLALFYSTESTQQLKSNGGTPMFAEPPPYSDLFFESLKTEILPISTPTPKIPIRQLQTTTQQQFDSLLSNKRIEIIKLGTYQGRLSSPKYDSTNGCTVISPLIVATHIYPKHYKTTNKQYKHAISNTEINEIIDKRSPPILHTIRTKYGLNKHALIIPSDVHDYLVDEGILPQEKFVGVCGGDILNEGHWRVLSGMVCDGVKKVGAALFFRDHVISLLKIPLGNGASYYDLIDSLPSPHAGNMACRIRCKDEGAFETVLQWYACSKFNEAHCDFIDGNEWNDGMCDFDPRVFQGFVWAE